MQTSFFIHPKITNCYICFYACVKIITGLLRKFKTETGNDTFHVCRDASIIVSTTPMLYDDQAHEENT